MSNNPADISFNDEDTFNKDLKCIFMKLINEKLPLFLDFCIQTHKAEAIKEVIYTISVNQFEVK